jgi:hypothetical protein
MHGNLHKSDDEDCVNRLDHNILAPSYENYNNSINLKNENLASSAVLKMGPCGFSRKKEIEPWGCTEFTKHLERSPRWLHQDTQTQTIRHLACGAAVCRDVAVAAAWGAPAERERVARLRHALGVEADTALRRMLPPVAFYSSSVFAQFDHCLTGHNSHLRLQRSTHSPSPDIPLRSPIPSSTSDG